MTEVTIEVSSQRQAVLDHRIISRTITTNVTIIMLVSRTITHDRHMRDLIVFKLKKMIFNHGQILIHKDIGKRHSIRYHLNVSVFIKRQQLKKKDRRKLNGTTVLVLGHVAVGIEEVVASRQRLHLSHHLLMRLLLFQQLLLMLFLFNLL